MVQKLNPLTCQVAVALVEAVVVGLAFGMGAWIILQMTNVTVLKIIVMAIGVAILVLLLILLTALLFMASNSKS